MCEPTAEAEYSAQFAYNGAWHRGVVGPSSAQLMSNLWHAREFVPAQNFAITNYKCTNWNGFMFNECTATFISRQGRESRQITDWRFGLGPRDPVQLLQWRDDLSSVTTDVSLQTLWNRLLVAVTLVLFGVFLAITLIVKAFKAEGAPIGAPSGEPALQPMGRSTFGKRHARRESVSTLNVSRAALIAATSIFFMSIIASNARRASGSPSV